MNLNFPNPLKIYENIKIASKNTCIYISYQTGGSYYKDVEGSNINHCRRESALTRNINYRSKPGITEVHQGLQKYTRDYRGIPGITEVNHDTFYAERVPKAFF